MRYTTRVRVDLPRSRVVELFEDPAHYREWQAGLVSFERTSGDRAGTGATAKLVFEQRGRLREMRETVVADRLPESIERTYETDGVVDREVVRFAEDGAESTWVVDESDFRFRGPMRLISRLMEPAFRVETQRTLDAFRDFAMRQATRQRQPEQRPEGHPER